VKEGQEIVEGKAVDAAVLGKRNFGMLADIPVRLSVEVGSTALKLSELMELAEGSVVELDRQSHELLDIMANGTLIAKGEVVTVNGRFGIRVVEVVAAEGAAAATAGIERRQ
jgi:flagellar motor switch protein FliN/FliY